MSSLLRIFENEVQIAALAVMAVVYTVRLIWLFRFKVRRERTFAAGSEGAGVGHSLMNIAMPWAMESTRKRPGFYAQFVIFHLGVAASIAASFIIPYAPGPFSEQADRRAFPGGHRGGLRRGAPPARPAPDRSRPPRDQLSR